MAIDFFAADTTTEKFYLDEKKEYWVDFKMGVSMEDMLKVQSSGDPSDAQKDAANPYHNLLVSLSACISAWNLTDSKGVIQPVTLENIKKLPMVVVNKMAPMLQKLSAENFLVDKSGQASAPQSSTEGGM